MRIVIEWGHSLKDPGAVGSLLPQTEAQANRKIAQALAALSSGAVIYEIKNRGVLGIGALLNSLRKNKPDVFITIHMDSSGPVLQGTMIYYNTIDHNQQRRAKSKLVATMLAQESQGIVRMAPYPRGGDMYMPGALVNTAKQIMLLYEADNIANLSVEQICLTPAFINKHANAIDTAIRKAVDEGIIV